jgi:hypothetical protein
VIGASVTARRDNGGTPGKRNLDQVTLFGRGQIVLSSCSADPAMLFDPPRAAMMIEIAWCP